MAPSVDPATVRNGAIMRESISRDLNSPQKISQTDFASRRRAVRSSSVNTLRNLWVGLTVILLARLLGACSGAHPSSGGGGGGKFPAYNVIRLYNDSPGEIYGITLNAGGTDTTLDKLPAEHSPTRDRGIRPETQFAEVRWQTADGARQQQTVQIAGKLPPGFHGVIVLKLKPTGNVETEFVRYEDLQ
jgi:hypothetical protein